MFGRRRIWLVLAFAVLVTSAAAIPLFAVPQSAPEPPLSNGDIIKLSKLQLGDEVILAKIKQAKSVAFDLTTDGLIQLKQAAVSGKVISAMLERATVKQPSLNTGSASGNASEGDGQVRLVAGDQEISLPSNRGDLSATGMWPVVFTFLDYPGRSARTRIQNLRPTLLVRSEHDPKGYYYLAKLDVNDEEDNNRSLKIEQKAAGFTATTRVVPAGRWHVEYDASETTPGVWSITPTRDLQPGEYGVVVPGGILYEFGID
ncbi:MAG TPA: hypothetical protein VF432_04930 [Thermoanaerobaculia bacterium]